MLSRYIKDLINVTENRNEIWIYYFKFIYSLLKAYELIINFRLLKI